MLSIRHFVAPYLTDRLGIGVPSVYALEHTLPKKALYVPKRMLTIVVPDGAVEGIVNAIVNANRTGKHGDGKIFVSPIGGAVRVRTGETDGEAVA